MTNSGGQNRGVVHALARAKLNLSLSIEGLRDDGMHLLDSVVCSISLSDRVTLGLRDDEVSTLEVVGAGAGPDSLNLALKASHLFRESMGGPGHDILLEKRIPVGAGMGGGSADAAAVLVLARELASSGVSDADLAELGAELGADVPFCVTGGLARMRGVGDEIEEIPMDERLAGASLVVAVPDFWMPTAEVYAAWDRSSATGTPDPVPAPVEGVVETFANDLEPAAEALVPAMRRHRDHFTSVLGAPARMTGSGSAMFGFARSPAHAESVANELRGRFAGAWVCSPVPRGVEIGG